MARADEPVVVVVTDNHTGMKKMRRLRDGRRMYRDVCVVSATAGPDHIPDSLVPSAVYTTCEMPGRLAAEWRAEVLEVLLARCAA